MAGQGAAAANVVEYEGENARSRTVRAVCVLEQLEMRGDLTNEQVDAGRDLAGLIEAGERAAWSLTRDDTPPVSGFKDPLAAWTRGFAANALGVKPIRRRPPPQIRPHPKRVRTCSDGMSVARLDAMRGSIKAMRLLKTMDRDTRAVVLAVAVWDHTVNATAKSMRGGDDGASRRWVLRRLRAGLDDLAAELRPHLKEVA